MEEEKILTSDQDIKEDFQDLSGELKTEKPWRSKLAMAGFIISIAYMIYSIIYWGGAVEDTAGGIAALIVLPHLLFVVMGLIFNGIGYFGNRQGFMLAAGIMYAISIFMMPMYIMFVLIQTIFSFVAYGQIRKFNEDSSQ